MSNYLKGNETHYAFISWSEGEMPYLQIYVLMDISDPSVCKGQEDLVDTGRFCRHTRFYRKVDNQLYRRFGADLLDQLPMISDEDLPREFWSEELSRNMEHTGNLQFVKEIKIK